MAGHLISVALDCERVEPRRAAFGIGPAQHQGALELTARPACQNLALSLSAPHERRRLRCESGREKARSNGAGKGVLTMGCSGLCEAPERLRSRRGTVNAP